MDEKKRRRKQHKGAVPTNMKFESNGNGSQSGLSIVNIIYNIHSTPRQTEKDNKVFTALRAILKKKYAFMQMPPVPWLQGHSAMMPLVDLYVELEMFTKDLRGIEQTGVTVDLTDIFCYNKEDPIGSTILVEGGAGFGKSTLSRKLAQDWAREEEYMRQFDFVVLLYMRYFEGSSLETTLTSILKIGDHTPEDILEEITTRNTLLIFDGYDELSDENEQVLTPLLRKCSFPKATIVVTTRPGKLAIHQEEEDAVGGEPSLMQCFDQRLVINGITEKSQNAFLQKYLKTFNTETKNTLMNKLDQFHLDSDFLRCPMILVMMVLLAQEVNLESITNKTGLYKHLFNFLVQRELSRLGFLQGKLDLFQAPHTNQQQWFFAVNLVDQFGALALLALIRKQVTFTESEILDNIHEAEIFLKLGFLTQVSSTYGFEQRIWYEPVHLTIMEFAAAFHIWRQPRKKIRKILSEVDTVLPANNGVLDSMLLPFLGGLLDTEGYLLYEAMKPYIPANYYWYDSYYSILAECPIIKENLTKSQTTGRRKSCISISRNFQSEMHTANEHFKFVTGRRTSIG